ncbi:unnamed protein product [Urochloa humidicola]
MAGTASKFTVRRRPAVLVSPAAATPRELKPLSDLDDRDSMRVQIASIYFYRRNEAMAGEDPTRVIRDAVARALVPYYPLAGRLREHDGGNKLAVDCTAEGVLFVEADADVGLEHFGDALLPPFPCIEELIFDVPGSSAILNTPLLLVQVTRLACGGFILAVRANHTMADAQGLTQFLTAVAELARGAQAPTLPPVWERHLLLARNPPQPPPALPGNIGQGGSSSIILPPNDDMRLRSFYFGLDEVAAIRAELPPGLQERATRFDVIAGWLWKSRTAALAPSDPAEPMTLLVVVNARSRGIPAGYYGNAFACPAAVSAAGELCASPVSYAVELVRKAKDEVDGMEYMRSAADLLVLRRGRVAPRVTPATYSLSDMARARFDGLDFGWGKPVYGGPAEAVGSPALPWVASFLIPFKDGVVVPVCLPGSAMDRLVEEMEKLRAAATGARCSNSLCAFPPVGAL